MSATRITPEKVKKNKKLLEIVCVLQTEKMELRVLDIDKEYDKKRWNRVGRKW